MRALVRSETSAAKVSALGAEPVRGELTDATTWQNEVTGSDVVFHLAAETDITADRERHELVSVRGTRAAVDAARHARVPRFVHCGSEAALLAGPPLVEVDESAPLRPDSEAAYSAAKAAAEKIVLDANAPDFATVSIRPRFVWGPHSILVEGLAAAAKEGQFAWIDGGRRHDRSHVRRERRRGARARMAARPSPARPISSPTGTASRCASSWRPSSRSLASICRYPNWTARRPPVRSPYPPGGSSDRSAPCGPTRQWPSSDTSPLFRTPPAWTPSGIRWPQAAHEPSSFTQNPHTPTFH